MDKENITKITDATSLRNLMENANRLDRQDVYWLAFKQLCSLEGMSLNDPLEREFYDVLNAYEELLTEKNGRTTKATRTRRWALATESVPSSQGRTAVPTPKGSDNGLRKVCQ